MTTLPPVEPHPDAHFVRLALSKQYRERQEKLAWLEAVAAEEDGAGCRDWPWALNNKGYAQIRWDGKQQKAGHVILEMTGRKRPAPTMMQLHSCDRPICVAPWHLRWGTAKENVADSLARDRWHGETRRRRAGYYNEWEN
jgi:hypothetical protein